MNQTPARRQRQTGFTMIEVMVSLVIILLGLLGLAGLQTRLHQAEFESYQRSQALVLLYDMVERINLHRDNAPCFAISASGGTPTFGTGSGTLSCTLSGDAEKDAAAQTAMQEWDSALKGAAETAGGVSVGAMLGARGCVMYDPATELAVSGGGGGTGVFTVAVSWQGTTPTVVPGVNCGTAANYGGAELRRTVFTTFRLAKLN
jgi:type IV pilus assembly protein PilV